MKKNIFKKLFIKISKLVGYEIIDQNEFYSPTLEKPLNEKLSNVDKSIILPLGEVKLTKKIKNLSIIFRTNSNVDIWDQNKKRVFEEPKIEYVLRCLFSLTKSINRLKEENSLIDINLVIIDDNSTLKRQRDLSHDLFIRRQNMNTFLRICTIFLCLLILTGYMRYNNHNLAMLTVANLVIFVLFGILGGIIASIIDVMILGYPFEENGPINLIFSVALIVPSLSVAARRLHDINKSGWWQLLWITIIGGILLIIWHATEGENKKNKFGSPIKFKK